ncbi:hypothetical protein D3C78_653460 [compost metagenome]
MAGFQWLPEHLQNLAIKLRYFVQKQDAVMGEGDFAGLRFRAAPHQRGAGRRVMRLAKRPLRPMAQRRATDDRLNRRHFQRFIFGERRQQSRQAARQQGFPRSRRPAEQQVVSTSGSDQQRTLGRELPLHFIQVGVGFAGVEQAIGDIRLNRCMPIEMRNGLKQMIHRNYFQSRGQARLFSVSSRHHQPAPGLARRQRRWQDPTNRPHGT